MTNCQRNINPYLHVRNLIFIVYMFKTCETYKKHISQKNLSDPERSQVFAHREDGQGAVGQRHEGRLAHGKRPRSKF